MAQDFLEKRKKNIKERFIKDGSKNMKMYMLLVLSALIFSGVTNISGTAEDGKKIFDDKCKGCHGGRPDVPSIKILSELSEKDIVNKVRNGVQGTMMRSFSTDELSENDLNNIIVYLKNSSPAKKTSGFDINFGILGILFVYIIYNKKKI